MNAQAFWWDNWNRTKDKSYAIWTRFLVRYDWDCWTISIKWWYLELFLDERLQRSWIYPGSLISIFVSDQDPRQWIRLWREQWDPTSAWSIASVFMTREAQFSVRLITQSFLGARNWLNSRKGRGFLVHVCWILSICIPQCWNQKESVNDCTFFLKS